MNKVLDVIKKRYKLLVISVVVLIIAIYGIMIGRNMMGSYCYTFDSDTGTIESYKKGIMCGTTVNIPSKINGEKVKIIGEEAFSNMGIKKVTIPSSITEIKQSAFYKNKITSLDISEGVISIEQKAFSKNKIKDLSLPISLVSIGDESFSYNDLVDIELNDGLEIIGEDAFRFNEIAKIVLSNTIRSIGSNAFADNEIKSVKLKGNLADLTGTYIGETIFGSDNVIIKSTN